MLSLPPAKVYCFLRSLSEYGKGSRGGRRGCSARRAKGINTKGIDPFAQRREAFWCERDPFPYSDRLLAVLSFEDDGDGHTRYVARARHWTSADRVRHEQMGFHEGWTLCSRQLEERARGLT